MKIRTRIDNVIQQLKCSVDVVDSSAINKKKIYYIILFLLSIMFSSSCTQKDYHNWNFSFEATKDEDPCWYVYGKKFSMITLDTFEYVDGKQSWVINGGFFDRFDLHACQYLNLPSEATNIKVTISSMSHIASEAWLKLYCIDSNEEVLASDSVSIISPDKWMEHSTTISLSGVQKLYIEISARSKDTIILQEDRQKVWIDNFRLKVDGRDYNGFAGPKIDLKNETSIKYLELDTTTYEIEDLENPKIIGLGESIHGSKQAQSCSFGIIKHLIQKSNCRLVLLEVPFELGLVLNAYVQDSLSIDIHKSMAFYNYNLDKFKELLDWIKNYNCKNNETVTIAGIDSPDVNWAGYSHLWTFIKHQETDKQELEPLFNYLKKGDKKSALMWVKNTTHLKNINKTNRLCIERALRLRLKEFNPKPSLIEGDREYLQFLNAQYAIDIWLNNYEKAVVYAHLGHINKKSNSAGRYYIPNFGNYMSSFYQKDYFAVALLFGHGTFSQANDSGDWLSIPLSPPVIGSIENLCLKIDAPAFYCNTTRLNSTYLCRNIGIEYKRMQFLPFNHKGRVDGLIFFEQSCPHPAPENWQEINKDAYKIITNSRSLKF